MINGQKVKFKRMCSVCKKYFYVFVSATNRCRCDNCRVKISQHSI